MKKIIVKSIKTAFILSLIFSFIFYIFIFLNAFRTKMINIDELIKMSIIIPLCTFGFFLIVIFLIELPFYLFKIYKKVDNVIAYNYEDSGDSIYNRDLPTYNSALAGYIVDYTTDAKQDYIALFVELIGRKIINRDYKGIKLGEDVIKSTENIKLTKSELFVIATYQKYKELTAFDFLKFKELIQQEAIESKFIKDTYLNYLGNKIEFLSRKYIKNPIKETSVLYVIGYIVFFALLVVLGKIPFPLNLLVIIIAILVFRCTTNTKRYTKLGKKEKEKMAKFRKFMQTQTSLAQKDINDRNFEKFIPYAIAFNVNNIYQKKFENILLYLK